MFPKKILVVDDEEIIHLLLKRVLGNAGYELKIAGSAKNALDEIQSSPWDMLITDVSLPDGDSTAVVRKFREKFPHNGILIMTGEPGSENDLTHNSKPGPTDCLYKPFDIQELETKVTGLLQKAPNVSF